MYVGAIILNYYCYLCLVISTRFSPPKSDRFEYTLAVQGRIQDNWIRGVFTKTLKMVQIDQGKRL